MASWANPKQRGGHVGTVFFNTNITEPDTPDDDKRLDELADFYKDYVPGGFSLVIFGWADYRSTSYEGGNPGLAADRAKNTYLELLKRWQDNYFLPTAAVSCFFKGLGVDPASAGTAPTDEALAGYRRADIFVSPVALPPPPEPGPEEPMSDEWTIDVENCVAMGLSIEIPGLAVGMVKELFNARITDVHSGESLYFTFDGEGVSAGVSLPRIPIDVSYRSGSAQFKTSFKHALREFEGRIAHASGQVAPGVGKDVLVLDVKGRGRQELLPVEIELVGASIGLPSGASVSGDLKIVGPVL